MLIEELVGLPYCARIPLIPVILIITNNKKYRLLKGVKLKQYANYFRHRAQFVETETFALDEPNRRPTQGSRLLAQSVNHRTDLDELPSIVSLQVPQPVLNIRADYNIGRHASS